MLPSRSPVRTVRIRADMQSTTLLCSLFSLCDCLSSQSPRSPFLLPTPPEFPDENTMRLSESQWDSKAALKSTFNKITAHPYPQLFFLQKAYKLVKQHFPLVDLCWSFLINFLSFICYKTDFKRVCSMIFPVIEQGRRVHSSLGPLSYRQWS